MRPKRRQSGQSPLSPRQSAAVLENSTTKGKGARASHQRCVRHICDRQQGHGALLTLSECCGRVVEEEVGPMPHKLSADELAHCCYCNTINSGTTITHCTVITVNHVLKQRSEQLCYSNTGKRSNFVGRGACRRCRPFVQDPPPPPHEAVDGLSWPKAAAAYMFLL